MSYSSSLVTLCVKVNDFLKNDAISYTNLVNSFTDRSPGKTSPFVAIPSPQKIVFKCMCSYAYHLFSMKALYI